MNIAFTLNEKPASIEIEPRKRWAEVLRLRCRLTGVKISCESQVCGSCTVLVDALPVSGCTYLAYEVRGKARHHHRRIGGRSGCLHPLQQAFLDQFAFQCGFCTPGMILAAKAFLDEKLHDRRDEKPLSHVRSPMPKSSST